MSDDGRGHSEGQDLCPLRSCTSAGAQRSICSSVGSKGKLDCSTHNQSRRSLYAAKIQATSLRMANRNPDFKTPVGAAETTVRSMACAVTFRLGISPVVYAVTQRHKTGAVSVRYNTNIAFWGLPLPLHSFLHCLGRNSYGYYNIHMHSI